MKLTKKILVEQDGIADITCDICQKSCLSHEEGDFKEFDYLEINGVFGYHSKRHDTEKWNAHICEDCSENILEKIICFRKTEFIFNETNNIFEDKRADRIRKIRKLTGQLEFEIVKKVVL